MSVRLPIGPPKRRELRFTPKELEFIELRYEQGKELRDVAGDLGITTRTVNFHQQSVTSKLGLAGNDYNHCTMAILATKKLAQQGLIRLEK